MHRLTLSNMCYPNNALSAPRSNMPGLPSCRPLPILSPAGPLQIRAHPEHSRCWWDALADRPLPSPRPPCTWPAGQPAVRGPHTAAGMVSRTMPASHRLPRAQMRVSGTAETGRGAAGAARPAPGGTPPAGQWPGCPECEQERRQLSSPLASAHRWAGRASVCWDQHPVAPAISLAPAPLYPAMPTVAGRCGIPPSVGRSSRLRASLASLACCSRLCRNTHRPLRRRAWEPAHPALPLPVESSHARRTRPRVLSTSAPAMAGLRATAHPSCRQSSQSSACRACRACRSRWPLHDT